MPSVRPFRATMSSHRGLLIGAVVCILLSLSGAQTQRDPNCPAWGCPPDSECVNSSSCRCMAGFSSVKELITEATESCEDINECLQNSVLCGPFATCNNSPGSYNCSCNLGYRLLSGKKYFANKSENTCRDVDECTSGLNHCHPSTHCINKLGSYSCICRQGWKPVLGSPNGPINTVCEDVNECSSGQHECHSSTICINTWGSYKCRCRPGWKPTSGSLNGPKNTTCQGRPFPIWTLPLTAESQSLSLFSVEVQNLLRDFSPATANYTIQKLIEAVDKLLEGPMDKENLTTTERHQVATQLLKNMEQSLRILAQFLPKGPFTYTSPSNTELSLMIKEQDNKDVTTVHYSQGWMKLDWAVTAGSKSSENGYSLAGILSIPNLQKLLAHASMNLSQSQDTLKERFEKQVLGVSLTLLSNVTSIFLTNTDTGKLASNVTFNFSFRPVSREPRKEPTCAFWDTGDDGRGHWATDGCSMDFTTGLCHCNHLSSFAILMAQYHVKDPRLELVTKVGLSLSLVCLLLCIVTFLLVKSIQSPRTMVHLHLCICLFLGSVIFLVGVENEGGLVSTRCQMVAMLLHYLFLAAFCWMALEGVELYFLVVRVFQGQGLSTLWRCLIGYGVPLLIVAISAASRMDGYGHETYCWLNYRIGGFLWSFVGPLAFIIFCNSAIFVITVWKLTTKFSEINPNMKKLRKARVLTITAIAQLMVLGCTWVFGLLLFDPDSTWLSYIFTLLNCLQGLFLFVMLCLLNKKVREEYRKWACMVAGNKYSEFSSSTAGTGSSQSQTRALRPSESGM